MIYNLSSFFCGLLFGCGLTVSNMINPTKIQDFLDFFGNWDPSLALVMFSALTVTWLSYKFTIKKAKPKLAKQFYLPTKTTIDAPLVIGASVFGIGWGLSGYCPGPSITALSLGSLDALYFVIGMFVSAIVLSLNK